MKTFHFESFMSKYLYDEDFRKLSESDIEGALKKLGIDINEKALKEKIDQFKKSHKIEHLGELARAVDPHYTGMG